MITTSYTRARLPVLTLGLFLLCRLLPTSALAQRTPLIGVALGYEYGVPLAIERSPGVINRYDFGGEGYSYNHTFSAGARFVMPRLFDTEIGLVGGAGIALSRGNFRSVAFAGDSVTRLSDQSKVVPTEEFVVDAKDNLTFLDYRALIGLGEHLAVEIIQHRDRPKQRHYGPGVTGEM